MLFGWIPGARRSRSGVWWLTIAGCVALAVVIVGIMVVVGR
jgi:hypothetical protein